MSVRIAVLASGGGTNLQALIDHFGESPAAEVALVLSDRQRAGALDRARSAGIDARHVPMHDRSADAVTAETLDALEGAGIEVIALAGYLRLVPTEVVRRFDHRIVNVHPALLPAFGGRGMYGRRVHEAVLAAGCRITGATIHFVNERYDEGRIIAQWPVPVRPEDSAESLAARVLRVEHALYPAAVEWLARRTAGADGEAPVGPEAFRLDESGEPDRDGIRRILGLD